MGLQAVESIAPRNKPYLQLEIRFLEGIQLVRQMGQSVTDYLEETLRGQAKQLFIAWYFLASQYFLHGRYDEAETAARMALQADPNDLGAKHARELIESVARIRAAAAAPAGDQATDDLLLELGDDDTSGSAS